MLPVESTVICSNGHELHGRIFVPEVASQHQGPMRAEEWINQKDSFFPFLPDDAQKAVILNKCQVLVLTVAADSDPNDLPEEASIPRQAVSIELSGMSISGTVFLDMPANHERVLDVLNGQGAFLPVHEGMKHHLVAKRAIIRVNETEGEQ